MKRRMLGLIMSAVMLFGSFGGNVFAGENRDVTDEDTVTVYEADEEAGEEAVTEEGFYMNGDPIACETVDAASDDDTERSSVYGDWYENGTAGEKKTGILSQDKLTKAQLASLYEGIKTVSSL